MDSARRLGRPQIDVVAQLGVSTILLGGIYALIAVGLTLIFGIMRVVNFAHGEFLMLGMFGAWWLSAALHLDPLLALVPIGLVMYGFGMLVYQLLTLFLREEPIEATKRPASGW